MAKLSKRDMEELRDIFSLGCDYADTKTVVHEAADKTLQELGADLGIECMLITDGEYEGTMGLDDFEEFDEEVIDDIVKHIKERI